MSVPELKVAAALALAASSLIDEVVNGEEDEVEVEDESEVEDEDAAANLSTASLNELSFAIVTSPLAFNSVALFEFNNVFESVIFLPELSVMLLPLSDAILTKRGRDSLAITCGLFTTEALVMLPISVVRARLPTALIVPPFSMLLVAKILMFFEAKIVPLLLTLLPLILTLAAKIADSPTLFSSILLKDFLLK